MNEPSAKTYHFGVTVIDGKQKPILWFDSPEDAAEFWKRAQLAGSLFKALEELPLEALRAINTVAIKKALRAYLSNEIVCEMAASWHNDDMEAK